MNRPVQILQSQHGQFTRSLLGALLWNAQGLSDSDQQMIISFMQSCSICFEYQPADSSSSSEARFIAPDHLPKEPSRGSIEWDDDRPYVSKVFTFPFLTSTLMRSILSDIGSQARLSARYWRNGVYFYDEKRRSRAMIEQTWTDDWAGSIRIQCQSGDAHSLLQQILEIVKGKIDRLGFKPTSTPDLFEKTRETSETDPITFGRTTDKRQWYVSYARMDATQNNNLVQRFCEHAKQQGRLILRDEKQLIPGDRISQFMHDLSEGERIYIILSEAYLQSPFCMTELHGVWQRSQSDAEFIDRVRVYLSDDLLPGDTDHMLSVRDDWLQKLNTFDAIPISTMTAKMRADAVQINAFAQTTYDILALIYDHIQFRDETSLFNDVIQED